MSRLATAIAHHQRGLSELQRSRTEAEGWADDQRQRLDRQSLDPLESDGRRLVQALLRAAAEVDAAESMLS